MKARTLASAALAAPLMLTLAACGGSSGDVETAAASTSPSDAPASETPSEEPTESAEPEPTEQAAEDSSDEASAAGDITAPDWAVPPTMPKGRTVATAKAGDITIDIIQAGTTKATDTGTFVDPETNTPLVEVGDTLVFLNYVITNEGEPFDMPILLVDITARYADWPYIQGMDGLADEDLFASMNVNDDALDYRAYEDGKAYTLGTGETYTVGENFEYQKNSKINFEIAAIPADENGEILSEDAIRVKASGVIK